MIAVLAVFLAGAVLAVPASSKGGPATVAKKKHKKCKKGKKGKKAKKRKGCKRGGGGSSVAGLPGEATPSSPKQPNSPPPPPPDNPVLQVESVSLSASTVLGGTSTSGQVTLDQAAPSSGQQVDLSSNLPGRASVPASVVVASGQKTASFQVTTVSGPSPVTATLTASIGTSEATTTIKLVDRPSVDSVKLERKCFTPDTWHNNRVTLDIPAPADTVVSLSSDTPASLAPTSSTVTVPLGSTTAFFSVDVFAVDAPLVTVSAAASSTPAATASASVHQTEPDANADDLTLNPATVAPDSVSNATVTLDCEAPEGGTTVSLTSQSPSNVHVPGPIVIPEGQLSATFQVTVDPGTPDDNYDISATAGASTKHANLIVSSVLPT